MRNFSPYKTEIYSLYLLYKAQVSHLFLSVALTSRCYVIIRWRHDIKTEKSIKCNNLLRLYMRTIVFVNIYLHKYTHTHTCDKLLIELYLNKITFSIRKLSFKNNIINTPFCLLFTYHKIFF